VNVLLLSTGGGGGNIVRSVKALFHRDLAVTQRSDAGYAERLRAAVTTCCVDTNEFSLADLPPGEKLLIGTRTTRGLGARHDPDVAREALAESRDEVEALIARHAVIVVVGTGGKGTGAGTMFPLAQLAREQRKLVIPIFVRPSFERHEVDKRRYDHALTVSQQFDAAKIRLVEVLNDRGYTDADPKPQAAVWERMNLPIARGLRGLIYVLWELSQVDPSDLSALFAGHGRLRLGFGEVNPPAGQEPTAEQLERAVRDCWENPYYLFGKPAGTSLVCIQGDWSNVVDARIKGQLAVLATGGVAESPYTPLFARAVQSPRPWGVTALFAEHTGVHAPLDIAWPLDRILISPATAELMTHAEETERATDVERVAAAELPETSEAPDVPAAAAVAAVNDSHSFASLWEFAVAVNRSDAAALALASNGADPAIPIDGGEVRKLAGTVWFRSVAPKLSEHWRRRLLDALVESVEVPDHLVRVGRRSRRFSGLNAGDLRELSRVSVPARVRTDLEFMLTIVRLFGDEAVQRLRFAEIASEHDTPNALMSFMREMTHQVTSVK
jgi:cell division GTPase FtsZ